MIDMSQFRETHIKTNKEPYNPKHIINLIFSGVEYNEKNKPLSDHLYKKGFASNLIA